MALTDLWVEADTDLLREQHEQRMTSARIAAADITSSLVRSASRVEYDNRKAVFASRLDDICKRIATGDPTGFAVLRADLEASLDHDFDIVEASRKTAVSGEVAEAARYLGTLNEGDPVTVVIDGSDHEMTVKRTLRQNDFAYDSGGGLVGAGSLEASNVQVTFGPGRYSTEISVAQQASQYGGMPYIKTSSKEAAYNPFTDPESSYNKPNKGPHRGTPEDLFPEGGVPLHGDLTPEQEKWLKSRKRSGLGQAPGDKKVEQRGDKWYVVNTDLNIDNGPYPSEEEAKKHLSSKEAYQRYSGDPYWIESVRSPGRCRTCEASVPVGSRAFYWPSVQKRGSNPMECEKCGELSSANFDAQAWDEDMMSRGYASLHTAAETKECPTCHGKGMTEKQRSDAISWSGDRDPKCSTCGGKGWVKTSSSHTAGKYRAEVTGHGEKTWSNNELEYDTEEEAKAWLDDLKLRWMGYDMGRVVTTDTPKHEPVDMSAPLYQNFRSSLHTAADDGSIFCKRCGGQGMVNMGGAVRNCTSCKGTGLKPGPRKTVQDVFPDHQASMDTSWLDGLQAGRAAACSPLAAEACVIAEARGGNYEAGFNDGWSLTLRTNAFRKGAPFAGYADFDACVAANKDKDDPEAYCGSIKAKTEDKKDYGKVNGDTGGGFKKFPFPKAAGVTVIAVGFDGREYVTGMTRGPSMCIRCSNRFDHPIEAYVVPGEGGQGDARNPIPDGQAIICRWCGLDIERGHDTFGNPIGPDGLPVVPPQFQAASNSLPLACNECGKKFKRSIGPNTYEVQCPKCGSYDTEPDYAAEGGHRWAAKEAGDKPPWLNGGGDKKDDDKAEDAADDESVDKQPTDADVDAQDDGSHLDPTQMQAGQAVTIDYTLTGSAAGSGNCPATFESFDGTTAYFTYDGGRFAVTQQGGKWVDAAGTEFDFSLSGDPVQPPVDPNQPPQQTPPQQPPAQQQQPPPEDPNKKPFPPKKSALVDMLGRSLAELDPNELQQVLGYVVTANPYTDDNPYGRGNDQNMALYPEPTPTGQRPVTTKPRQMPKGAPPQPAQPDVPGVVPVMPANDLQQGFR